MSEKIETMGIVVVHFGNKKDTFECLMSLSLLSQEKQRLIVYLVDNDPQNRISTKELSFRLHIMLLTQEKNLGYGAGVNKGARQALKDRCDYILLLNNDVVVRKELFKRLLPYFNKKNVGIVSPMIVYYDNPQIIWCAHGHLNKRFLFTRYPFMNQSIHAVSLPDVIESDFGAACLLIDAVVFRKIGFLDERYFINVEDVEWCFRAKKAGFRLIYATHPLALHKVSANVGIKGTNLLTPLSAYFYARNFFLLMRDHRDSFNLFTAIIGQTFVRLPFYTLFRIRSFQAIREYTRGYIYGWLYLLTGKLL